MSGFLKAPPVILMCSQGENSVFDPVLLCDGHVWVRAGPRDAEVVRAEHREVTATAILQGKHYSAGKKVE